MTRQRAPDQTRQEAAMLTDRTDDRRPTIVLVHGAWADATGFDGVIRELQRQGHRCLGIANPLRRLSTDAAYVAETLRGIDGPLVFVGHSYGGAVITNAAVGDERAKALVYLNGWMPDEGESVAQLAELNPGSLLPDALRPTPFTEPDGSEGVDLYIDQHAFPAAFAGDVDPDTARVMAAAQRPPSGAALGTPSGPPAWRSLPSWYLLGTQDKAIPPATQRFMAERAGARITEIAASHASMVSQPEAATALIVEAVEATCGVPA
jgi:pimeloyl-ACP methyl ester carboxylesterase